MTEGLNFKQFNVKLLGWKPNKTFEETLMANQLRSGLAAVIVMAAGVVAAPSVSARVSDRPTTAQPSASRFAVQPKQSRVSQCNSLIGVVNQGQSSVRAIRNQTPSLETMTQLADILAALAQRTVQVRMADTTLQRYRNGFARIYSNLSRASRQVGSALAALQRIQQQNPSQANQDELQRLQDQISEAKDMTDQASVQERRLVDAVNSYCRGGR